MTIIVKLVHRVCAILLSAVARDTVHLDRRSKRASARRHGDTSHRQAFRESSPERQEGTLRLYQIRNVEL